MKKIVYALILFGALFPCQIFAVGFGGRLSSNHSIKNAAYGNFNFYESDKINLWFAATLNKSLDLRLNADVSYEFKYDTLTKNINHVLDVSSLKLSMSHPFANGSTINLSAGRFGIGDGTGIVFSQLCDGFFARFTHRIVDASAYVGVTSLLNTHNVKMILPQDTKFVPKENIFYMVGPTYMPVGVSLKFPELFAGQNLLFEVWHFRDFSKDDYQRYFATVQMAGPIVPKLFYSVMTTFETKTFSDLANLSQVMARFFPSDKSSVSASVVYASGANGFLRPFSGFTSFSSTDLLAGKEFSSLLSGTVSGSIELASQVYLGLEVLAFFTVPENEIKYDGILLHTNVLWNIFHDLKLSAAYIGYFARETGASKMKVSLGLTFLF